MSAMQRDPSSFLASRAAGAAAKQTLGRIFALASTATRRAARLAILVKCATISMINDLANEIQRGRFRRLRAFQWISARCSIVLMPARAA